MNIISEEELETDLAECSQGQNHGPGEGRTSHLHHRPRPRPKGGEDIPPAAASQPWLAAVGRVLGSRDWESDTVWTSQEDDSKMKISAKEVYYVCGRKGREASRIGQEEKLGCDTAVMEAG